MYVESAKLPYHGVLIERPCSNCDTCDLHFESECAMGPCIICGFKRGGHYDGTVLMEPHAWTPNHYQPGLIANAPESFDAMIEAVKLSGMPAHFTSDLYRDYQLLKGEGIYHYDDPVRRFIWCVRSTGTDLLSEHTQRQTAQLLVERAERIYLWNGFTLSETDKLTAMALLAAFRIGKRTGIHA